MLLVDQMDGSCKGRAKAGARATLLAMLWGWCYIRVTLLYWQM